MSRMLVQRFLTAFFTVAKSNEIKDVVLIIEVFMSLLHCPLMRIVES